MIDKVAPSRSPPNKPAQSFTHCEGIMAIMDYRTQDGLAIYGFAIEYQSEFGWRVYIVFEPFRLAGDDAFCLPHQAIDCDGRRYVNWPSRLDSLGDAKTVAALWAELVQSYRNVNTIGTALKESAGSDPVLSNRKCKATK